MSFASEVKDELALAEIPYPKDELSALFKMGGNITISNQKMTLNFKSENSKITQKVYKLIVKYYNVKPITSIYKLMKLNKNNVYQIIVQDKVTEILDDLSLINNDNIKNIIRSDNRIKSYLAGCFMASGSVNDPNSTNYHFEITSDDEEQANLIIRLLSKLNIKANLVKRRNLYVVYVKKSQSIADLIVYIGATNSYLKFEEVRLTRDYYNSDNRLDNCEIANSVRTNIAANSQIEDIKLIDELIGLESLDTDLYILSILRLENPEDSLRKLAEKFSEHTGRDITKSGINHLFYKIKEKANGLRK